MPKAIRNHTRGNARLCYAKLAPTVKTTSAAQKKRTPSVWNASTTPTIRAVHTIIPITPVLFVIDLLGKDRRQFGRQLLPLLPFLLCLLRAHQFASHVLPETVWRDNFKAAPETLKAAPAMCQCT
jgi:hypothetical protein